MNMLSNRFLVRVTAATCLAALAVVAFAGPSRKQSERIKAIWDSVSDRMSRQSDAWYEDGDFPKCIQNLRVMRSLFPDDYEVATNLGWMLENIHEWDEALSVYISYRTQHQADPEAAWPEANFYFMQKVYAKIPPILEPSLKSSRSLHPNVFRTLAHAYERLGMLKDSKRVWEGLIKQDPDDRAAVVNLKRVSDKLAGAGRPGNR